MPPCLLDWFRLENDLPALFHILEDPDDASLSRLDQILPRLHLLLKTPCQLTSVLARLNSDEL
jgi:hypothetical protein